MSPKVLHGFASINEDSDNDDPIVKETTTVAAELNQLIETYNRGMTTLSKGASGQALSTFDQILSHSMSIDVRRNPPPEGDPLRGLLDLCCACLKQKGELLVDDNPLEAFESLKEAFKIDFDNVILCKKLGTLALEINYVAFAKSVLESMLRQRPDFILLKEPLIEVCLELQEYEAAVEHAQAILKQLPKHKRALELIELNNGNVLLEPKIERRINWEQQLDHHLHVSVPAASWTALIRAIAEIIIDDGRIDDSRETKQGSIIIKSVNSCWKTIAMANIVCEISQSQQQQQTDTHEETVEIENDGTGSATPQSNKSRFPLRSRLSVLKPDETKTWNVFHSLKCAFPPDEWNRLIESWSCNSTEHEPETTETTSEVDALQAISSFIQLHDVSNGINTLSFATRLLEHRIGQFPANLEANEAEELCHLDGLIGFAAGPFYCLSMAELLLDAAVQCRDSDGSHKDDKLLQRSLRHLHKCIEYKFTHSTGELDATQSSFFNSASMARLHWALGKLHLIEGRIGDAEKALDTALRFTHQLPEPLVLVHVQNDATVSIEAIRHKRVMCLYHDLIDSLPDEEEKPLDVSLYEDMCALFVPVLLTPRTGKVVVVSEEYRRRGLSFLKEASNQADAADTELLCHLHLLNIALSSPVVSLQALDSHSATINELPSAMQSSIDRIPKKTDFMQIMQFVTFVQKQLNQNAGQLQLAVIFPSLREDHVVALLKQLLGKSVRHLEWCFWRFCCPDDSYGNSAKHDRRRRALHEATAFVFVLVQLIPSYSHTVEILDNLSLALFDLLSERGAISLKRSRPAKCLILHLFSERFSAWIEYFSRIEDEDPAKLNSFDKELLEINIENNKDIQSTIEALIDGVAHFIRCLYGLDLVSSADSEWHSRETLPLAQKDQLKKEDVPQLWSIVSPCLSYLESKEGDLQVFTKLRGFLSTLVNLIETPSPELLSTLSLDPIFVSECQEIDICLEQGHLPEIVRRSMTEREERVKNVSNLKIYENLYYYYSLAQLNDDADFASNDALLTEQGIQLVEDHIKWIKLDLVFNPDRHWTWECLAICFKDATNSFISVCIRDLLPGAFDSSALLNNTWKILFRTQRRCFQIAQTLAREQGFQEQYEYAEEMLMELAILSLTSPPPFLFPSGRGKRAQNIETWRTQCLTIKEHLNEHIKRNPSPKWQMLYYAAKLCWKAKTENWQGQALEYYARSMKKAQDDEGGLIDPFFRLHSCRLKLLLSQSAKTDILMKYMFDETLIKPDIPVETIIFEDCKAALQFCRTRISQYHYACYRLAQALHQKGNHTGALLFIQHLFVKGKRRFCIAFSPVDPRPCRQPQRSANKTGSPVKISGVGIAESVWKFVASVRKYLNLFIKLLYYLRDVDMLSIVVDALFKDDYDAPYELASSRCNPCKYPSLVDMPTRALGVKLLLIHDVTYATVPSEVALRMDERIESILSLLFHTDILDSDYINVAKTLDQILLEAGQLIERIREFDLTLFSAALEVLCEARCDLTQEKYLSAVNCVVGDYQTIERRGMDAEAILAQVTLFGMIYPMLVLHLRNTSLTSKLFLTLHQKSLKEATATNGNVIRRLLFVIVQLLFYRFEDIRKTASVIRNPTDQRDVAVCEVMQQTSSLIHQYGEMLTCSRFLCLRLVNLIRGLYEAMCMLYSVQPSLQMQLHTSLRIQAQSVGAAIRELRKMTKPPVHYIDLTTESDPSLRIEAESIPAVLPTKQDPTRPSPTMQPATVSSVQPPTSSMNTMGTEYDLYGQNHSERSRSVSRTGLSPSLLGRGHYSQEMRQSPAERKSAEQQGSQLQGAFSAAFRQSLRDTDREGNTD